MAWVERISSTRDSTVAAVIRGITDSLSCPEHPTLFTIQALTPATPAGKVAMRLPLVISCRTLIMGKGITIVIQRVGILGLCLMTCLLAACHGSNRPEMVWRHPPSTRHRDPPGSW